MLNSSRINNLFALLIADLYVRIIRFENRQILSFMGHCVGWPGVDLLISEMCARRWHGQNFLGGYAGVRQACDKTVDQHFPWLTYAALTFFSPRG
jgi:hypothetical protein